MQNFDFSNLPATLNPSFQRALNGIFQNVANGADNFEITMSFPDSLTISHYVFLLHVQRGNEQRHFINALYCLDESLPKRHVWAYATSPQGIGSPLRLNHSDEPFDLTQLIEYWQDLVLADMTMSETDFNYPDGAFWQGYEFVEHLNG